MSDERRIGSRIRAGAGLLLAGLLVGIGTAPARAQEFDLDQAVRASVTRSLPRLQSAGVTFAKEAADRCFSCHNESLPVMALSLARERGFQIDEKARNLIAEHIYGDLAPLRETAQKALTDVEAERRMVEKLVDPAISLGYGLAPLAAAKRPGDALTESLALYLIKRQGTDGRWPVFYARPPMEGSEFASTALAVRSINAYAPTSRAAEAAASVALARRWLLAAKPRNTEDRTFQLLGLRWAGASEAELRKASEALAAEQRDDGGWAQLPKLESDAYATGQVLVALHEAGLPVTDAIYTRGAAFLLGTQQKDGTWLVRKRTVAFQEYFEAGFPHGESQFISAAGSSWATMALTLLVPPQAPGN